MKFSVKKTKATCFDYNNLSESKYTKISFSCCHSVAWGSFHRLNRTEKKFCAMSKTLGPLYSPAHHSFSLGEIF